MTQTKMKGDEVVDEVRWLLDSGMHVSNIVTALGRTPEALSKVCRRSGAMDLAQLFEQERTYQRKVGQ